MTKKLVTIDKLKVFRRFVGKEYLWEKSGKNTTLEDGDWKMIDSLVEDLYLVQKGLASKEFKEKAMTRLAEVSENRDVEEEILKIASSLYTKKKWYQFWK